MSVTTGVVSVVSESVALKTSPRKKDDDQRGVRGARDADDQEQQLPADIIVTSVGVGLERY